MSSSQHSEDDSKRESIKTISIVAPMSLPEGYEFEATIDQRTIQVVVPRGGVQEGDVLHIPFDSLTTDEENPHIVAQIVQTKSQTLSDGSDGSTERLLKKNAPNTSKRNKGPKVNVVPEGIWRHGLCSCCEVICSSVFWMSLCFPWILMGQLLQRLKLNFWGCQAENYRSTCSLVVMFTIVAFIAETTLYYLSSATNIQMLSSIAYAISLYASILLIFWSYMLRSTLRRGFDLPNSCCSNWVCDDLFVALCCTCCSSIQIARHTHDDAIHRYKPCSPTGLPPSAPQVYYV